jgi:hypothetical protein
LILPRGEFDHRWKTQVEPVGGQENQVIFVGRNTVRKRTDIAVFHTGYLEYFCRLALHNALFPQAPVDLIGFDESACGRLLPVFEQPFIEAERGAKASEVRVFMRRMGFAETSEGASQAGWNWFHTEMKIIVEDMHDENVLLDFKGRLIPIDPVIYPAVPKSQFRKFRRLGLLSDV